jgi:hypothetical protein
MRQSSGICADSRTTHSDIRLWGRIHMHFRAPRTTVASAVCGLLGCAALAGCSSSVPQPSATLGGGPVMTVGAPAVTTAPTAATTLAGDFSVDFDLTITGTATQVQLLTQAKALILAYEQAVEQNNPKAPLYQSMITGSASENLYQSIVGYQNAQQRPTGTLLFYQFSTDETPKVAADVLFCENRSQVKLVNFKTGAPLVDNDAQTQHWDFGFKPNSNGTWSIVYVSAQPVAAGSTQCT